MTRLVLGPCSPFSVSTDLLQESAKLARACKVSLHTHLCETMDEERFTLERYQLRPVAWMATLDWMGSDVWFAHAIHVDDDEIQELGRGGVGVAHCPCSNMRLASGIAPIKKYMAAGVKVGLGVDGSASNDASNILLEARQALLLARLRMGLLPPEGPRKHFLLSQSHPLRASEWMTAREALEIATRGGAAVLGRDDIGALEAGKCGDFFSVDLNTVDYAGALHDSVAATLFCAPQKARYTVINGRLVVENGRVMTVNMNPVVEAHNRFARQFAASGS
jgi:8-oxoguanine deaminase